MKQSLVQLRFRKFCILPIGKLYGNYRLLSLSLEYRSVIRSTRLLLYNNDLDETLKTYELIWSLVEIIFMKSHDSSIVIDLITWARLCFPFTYYVDEISPCLRQSKIRSLDKRIFWQQIAYFLLSGLFKNAITMLETYGQIADDEAVRKLADEIRDLCMEKYFESNRDAEMIALLLSGDQETLLSLSHLVDNWFELVPAYALFIRPYAALSDLHEIAKTCANICGCNDHPIDDIISSLFSLDAPRALQNIARASADWWLAAHLADLLQKADNRTTTVFGVDIRQHLLVDYALSLFSYSGLWQISFDYLKECGSDGFEKLELLIPAVPLNSDITAIKLNDLCLDLGLNHLCADINKAMAYRMLRHKEWGSALTWALRSVDTSLHSAIADYILHFCPPEVISSIAVLEQMSEIMLKTPALVFLHEYRKFQNLLRDGDKTEAVNLLVTLIIYDFAPDKFRANLFNDLITILNLDCGVVNKERTMQVLQYLAINSTSEKRLDEENMDILTSEQLQVNILRQALLKNLLTAVIS
ncbi:unnamed protein product [Dracunculus medinensis]|uniref:Nuclear pore complex protein Nup85 n=1 Tax=Dracunculus medinensis TaxID=318479 RepID=A0A0N4UIQ3_DRAME|nr:unnamed protein product [Dracunculus medinensis]